MLETVTRRRGSRMMERAMLEYRTVGIYAVLTYIGLSLSVLKNSFQELLLIHTGYLVDTYVLSTL